MPYFHEFWNNVVNLVVNVKLPLISCFRLTIGPDTRWSGKTDMFVHYKNFIENKELVEEINRLWGEGKKNFLSFDCYSKYI